MEAVCEKYRKVNKMEGSPGWFDWVLVGIQRGLGCTYPITLDIIKLIETYRKPSVGYSDEARVNSFKDASIKALKARAIPSTKFIGGDNE